MHFIKLLLTFAINIHIPCRQSSFCALRNSSSHTHACGPPPTSKLINSPSPWHLQSRTGSTGREPHPWQQWRDDKPEAAAAAPHVTGIQWQTSCGTAVLPNTEVKTAITSEPHSWLTMKVTTNANATKVFKQTKMVTPQILYCTRPETASTLAVSD